MDKEKKEKKVKKDVQSGEENFLLKKIRYYQGTIKDYDTYWNEKIAEGEREESPETKSFAKKNAELNKAFEIVPVEKDDTVMAKDVVSGKDVDETPKENPDAKPTGDEEGGKVARVAEKLGTYRLKEVYGHVLKCRKYRSGQIPLTLLVIYRI